MNNENYWITINDEVVKISFKNCMFIPLESLFDVIVKKEGSIQGEIIAQNKKVGIKKLIGSEPTVINLVTYENICPLPELFYLKKSND